ncbi:MAG: sulfite exporter TauE/SafE family protein, partial [Solirubrobacteraceae bacterium]|nr:sulfite exporter TauE/SafE family protein [Solirubrobacteraceae bacterium]
PVSAPEAIAILLAGVAAGTINTVVGSGTLITFPVLLWAGYAPLVANVSNTIGLVPGSVSGAIGYRRELAGQRERAWQLGRASLLGGITGAGALLLLPEASFDAIVPFFVALALVLVVIQPRLGAYLARRRERHHPHGGAGALAGVYGAGVYGGYFGAAQGIMLLAVMGLTLDEDLHRINALKNVLAGLVNGVAGMIFVLVAPVAWGPVLLIAAGSIAGGQLGGRYGRRLPPRALRALIVVVGLAAIVQLTVG